MKEKSFIKPVLSLLKRSSFYRKTARIDQIIDHLNRLAVPIVLFLPDNIRYIPKSPQLKLISLFGTALCSVN